VGRRYLVFKVEGRRVSKREVEALLEESLKELFGDLGLAKTQLTLLDYEPERGGIIRVDAGGLEVARAAIAAMRPRDFVLYVIKVSGTLKKARAILASYSPRSCVARSSRESV